MYYIKKSKITESLKLLPSFFPIFNLSYSHMELGIAEEWVPAIQKAGYNLVSDMKDVNPQKLHQDICGINKKYKLN